MQFKGCSQEANSAFLGADFWKPGRTVTGEVVRTFETENGPCYVLKVPEPVAIGGEEFDQVSIGNLTGFRMALQAAGLDRLKVGDALHIECTGLKPTTKGSPRANFAIEVNRP